MSVPIAVVVLGQPPEALRAAYGDFYERFVALLERHDVQPRRLDGLEGPGLVRPEDYAGVVWTGSPASLTEREPWMERAIAGVRACLAVGTPTLGVCFGHQVMGAALGAEVRASPLRLEYGSYEVNLLEDGATDPLYEGVPPVFWANHIHSDEVVGSSLPEEVRTLAASERAHVQSLAVGDTLRSVQFHPEFRGAATRDSIESYRTRLVDLGVDPDERISATRDCPDAVRVFDNWIGHFAQKS